MIRVHTFSGRMEAEFFQVRLKESDIESILKSDDISGAYPGVTGVKLYVAEKDYETAKKIITEEPAHDIPAPPAEESSDLSRGFLTRLRNWLKGDKSEPG